MRKVGCNPEDALIIDYAKIYQAATVIADIIHILKGFSTNKKQEDDLSILADTY